MRDWATWSRFIREREAIPFAWGPDGLDCVRFAAGAVLALTARNPLDRVAWNDKRSAKRLLAGLGGLAAAVSARLEEIAPAHAHRGDIAGVDDPELGLTLMVIEGPTLVSPGERGLCRAPRTRIARAWSAG